MVASSPRQAASALLMKMKSDAGAMNDVDLAKAVAGMATRQRARTPEKTVRRIEAPHKTVSVRRDQTPPVQSVNRITVAVAAGPYHGRTGAESGLRPISSSDEWF